MDDAGLLAALGNALLDTIADAAKTENWLYTLRDAGFLNKEFVNARLREGLQVQKMLNGLIRSIRNSDT